MPIHSVQVVPSPFDRHASFALGRCSGPGCALISVDSISLLRDGRRWLGVMGEVHYARLDPSDWAAALAKMKAGGLDVVASYVFWIHHEEIEGEFDWTGSRDLRRFVETCAALELPIVVRCGPWCHGEVRNGGLPDWILDRGFETRSLAPTFLRYTRRLYEAIASQLKNLLWKDGGPVIGIQVDNEYAGPGEYLIELKRIAREVGLDVPIYTRTGWPSTATPVPFGELLPLFGAYAEGFWERSLDSMPGNYWRAFCFEHLRTDTQVGFDQLGERAAADDADTRQYPYLTCEIGGGMEMAYHRRVKIEPMDILSVVTAKLGSGSNLPGYYMYHGGLNPDGRVSTLHESQATRYWNDVPVKSYDFQAPLGSFGQVRPHYHLLRRLHLFLQDFGESLASMSPSLPTVLPSDKTDQHTLRWALRASGTSGYVFVNNYQRSMSMPEKNEVQFDLSFEDGSTVRVPAEPATIPADSCFLLPIGMNLGGVTLLHATAQPICRIKSGNVTTYFFTPVLANGAAFVFETTPTTRVRHSDSQVDAADGRLHCRFDRSSREPCLILDLADGQSTQIVLLDQADSLRLWKLTLDGLEYAVLTDDTLWVDTNGDLRIEHLSSDDGSDTLSFYPAPLTVRSHHGALPISSGGSWSSVNLPGASPTANLTIAPTLVKKPGQLRTIRSGSAGVAEAPSEDDFDSAAEYEIVLPDDLSRTSNALVRVHYIGDVARLICDGRMVLDDFYNGDAFDCALRLISPGTKRIVLQILPLQKDAPIFLAASAVPDFESGESAMRVSRIELLIQRTTTLTIRSPRPKTSYPSADSAT